jgi:hypothetical protein
VCGDYYSISILGPASDRNVDSKQVSTVLPESAVPALSCDEIGAVRIYNVGAK